MKIAAACLAVLLAPGAARAAGNPSLSCTVYVPVSRVNVGAVFTVEARLFNSGDTQVNFVFPCPSYYPTLPLPAPDCIWVTPEAGGNAGEVLGSQPQPQVQAFLLQGMTTSFTWTFSATGAGAVDFTVSAIGREVGGPGFPKAVDTVTLLIQNPAALSATVTTSSSGAVRYGDSVTVYLDVYNFGDASADGVIRFSITVAGSGRLAPLACPPLAPLCPDNPASMMATVEHNSATRFTWLYRADGPGDISVNVTAAGTDHNDGMAVYSNATATTFTVPVPPVLSYTVTGAEGVVQGELVMYQVAVTNLGTTPVCQSAFNVSIEDQGTVRPSVTLVLRELGDSLLPICYEPGQVRTFTLQFPVPSNLPPGFGVLFVEPVATEAWTGAPAIATGAARPLFVVASRSGFCGFSANPWRPRTGPLKICYAVSPDDAGRPVSVAVYTLAGELVRTLESEVLATGVYGEVWDGRNRSGQKLASGVYLLLFQSYRSKDTRKLAVLQ
ncbi:MAG: FlgD immunoglobulin-like domain containing protein [Candidatus Coatesbacteria bacterium]|mgnify:CR=1 FL=1